MARYQDYIIKDGKFIGKFEEMYQRFEDPWRQAAFDSNLGSYSKNIAILNMKKHKLGSIVECGCGLGYYTDMINKNIEGIKIKGIDISLSAIKRAKALHSGVDFTTDNINNIERYANYRNVLLAEVTWYILNDLDTVFKKMLSHFRGGYFLHNLVFYRDGVQKYGREFFTTLGQFIDYVPFKLVGQSQAEISGKDTIETSTIFKITPK
jgi:SAM-dependent methyltransferase